jgi:DNA-directed RNA polymerase subunit L
MSEITVPELVKELFIDVSQYEAPQPFEKVIQLLITMKQGEYILMHHRQKPIPLLQFLQDNYFEFNIQKKTQTLWEVVIWNKKDVLVAHYCSTHW